MNRIRWTPEAAADLEAIRDFIARDSPHYAAAVVARILGSIDQLELFLRSGHVVPELQRGDVRQLIEGPYRIVYRILPDDIAHILVIFRSSRPLPRMPDA